MLALQRSAGNAAVTRLLARDMLSNALGDAPVAAPASYNVRDPLGVGDLMADETAAGQAAFAYFDAQNKGGIISISVAGLVHKACEQAFTLKDGTKRRSTDKIPATEVEQRRGCVRALRGGDPGARGGGDLPGIKSEMDAHARQPRRDPDRGQARQRRHQGRASIFGKVNAEAKAGPVKIEGEGSSEGIEGGVTVGPGKVSFGQKGVKAEIKVGDLIRSSGGLSPTRTAPSAGRRASVGTIGKLIMPEDVAKVFSKARRRRSPRARASWSAPRRPAKVKEHGRGSRRPARPRSRRPRRARSSEEVGLAARRELKGDGSGGISGGFTLTWAW